MSDPPDAHEDLTGGRLGEFVVSDAEAVGSKPTRWASSEHPTAADDGHRGLISSVLMAFDDAALRRTWYRKGLFPVEGTVRARRDGRGLLSSGDVDGSR